MTAQSEAGSIGGYSSPQNSTKTWTYGSNSQSTYTSGQLWINITTTDAYGRTDVDVYTFIIDDEVTSTPTLATTGTQTIINGSTYLGANGRITLDNLVDAGGVGVDYAECFWDDEYKHTGEYPFHNSTHSAEYCRPNHSIHTQLSNRGPSRKHRKQHNHLRICRSPNSNNNNSTDGWKHHHGQLNHQLCNHRCKPERNINGDHHMDQCNQFMEHNGRLQRYMDWVHCRTQQQPG